jgi:hypothetical protein
LLAMPVFTNESGTIPEALALMTRAEQRRLAMLMPNEFGNNDTIPFDLRAQANRVRISAQIHVDEGRIAELKAELREVAGSDVHLPDVEKELAKLEGRAVLYDGLLNTPAAKDLDGLAPAHRQIILFDPAGDGRIAEVSGIIDANTKNVGVYVPGTGHGLDDWVESVKRSNSFLKNTTHTAMITWIGSDLPDSVVKDAPNQKYAEQAGPALATFSSVLRSEIGHDGAGDAKVTYLGHSYGGAIVGEAERYGLDTDRVLMVEGAGSGPHIDSVRDLSAMNQKTPHYSMTAPGDIIEVAQLSGHLGPDPDTFHDAVVLQTGRDGDKPIEGFSSHGGVFATGSDAWNNMLAVITGGTATLRHDDELIAIDYQTGQPIMASNYDSGGTVNVK